jgi:alpha-beta hydrolase superfamily lysophospholipase
MTRTVCQATWLISIVLTLGAAVAAAADTIAPGSGSFQFIDQLGNTGKPITVWTHAPQKLRAGAPIVFVMHGAGRNGRDYRDQWIEHAERQRFLLIVPEFAEPAYGGEAYQLGNMFDSKGKAVDPSKWTFTAIEHLFDHVKAAAKNTSKRYYIYGHSAGGQFVHRFVLFMPEARFERAIAANPGWYTMPELEVAFPYGMRNTAASKAGLKKSFANSLVLLLGDEDVNREDPNLRKSPGADLQGLTRFERGETFFKKAKEESAKLETPLAWRQQTVRGAGHSDKQMSGAAAKTLFSRAK